MGLLIKSFAGGSVELRPNDTANNVVLNINSGNGVISFADSSTGGLVLPVGNTAQRPSNAANGAMRFNTTTNSVEVYNGSSWG